MGFAIIADTPVLDTNRCRDRLGNSLKRGYVKMASQPDWLNREITSAS